MVDAVARTDNDHHDQGNSQQHRRPAVRARLVAVLQSGGRIGEKRGRARRSSSSFSAGCASPGHATSFGFRCRLTSDRDRGVNCGLIGASVFDEHTRHRHGQQPSGMNGRRRSRSACASPDRCTTAHHSRGRRPPPPTRTAPVLQPIPRIRSRITTARKPKSNTNPTTTTTTSIVLRLLTTLRPTASMRPFAG